MPEANLSDLHQHMKASDDGMREPAETVEQEIQRKGLTAPRITLAAIEANIESEHYFTATDGIAGANTDIVGGQVLVKVHNSPASLRLLTICVLVLRNGFTIVQHSAPASPENFNPELGKRIARENAVRAMWPLMGYALREDLYRAETYGTAISAPPPVDGG